MDNQNQDLNEGINVLGKIEVLVRMGLMPINTLPLLKQAFVNMEKDVFLPVNQRTVFYDFVTALMNLALSDETINRLLKQKTAMNRYDNIKEGVDLKKTPPGMLNTYATLVRRKLKNGLTPTKADRDMVARAKSELRRRRHMQRKRAMMKESLQNAMAHFNINSLQELPEDKVKDFFNYIETQGE